ncbi:hypothetical protein ACSBR1_003848 [Camellia fascicularis]
MVLIKLIIATQAADPSVWAQEGGRPKAHLGVSDFLCFSTAQELLPVTVISSSSCAQVLFYRAIMSLGGPSVGSGLFVCLFLFLSALHNLIKSPFMLVAKEKH